MIYSIVMTIMTLLSVVNIPELQTLGLNPIIIIPFGIWSSWNHEALSLLLLSAYSAGTLVLMILGWKWTVVRNTLALVLSRFLLSFIARGCDWYDADWYLENSQPIQRKHKPHRRPIRDRHSFVYRTDDHDDSHLGWLLEAIPWTFIFFVLLTIGATLHSVGLRRQSRHKVANAYLIITFVTSFLAYRYLPERSAPPSYHLYTLTIYTTVWEDLLAFSRSLLTPLAATLTAHFLGLYFSQRKTLLALAADQHFFFVGFVEDFHRNLVALPRTLVAGVMDVVKNVFSLVVKPKNARKEIVKLTGEVKDLKQEIGELKVLLVEERKRNEMYRWTFA